MFDYKREDLVHFSDRVRLKGNLQRSKLAVKDLHKFYSEIQGNDMLFLKGNFNGTLNNFSTPNLNMYSKNGLVIRGDMGFVNSFNSKRGFIFDADLSQVSSNYNQLKSLLPNVLGKTFGKLELGVETGSSFASNGKSEQKNSLSGNPPVIICHYRITTGFFVASFFFYQKISVLKHSSEQIIKYPIQQYSNYSLS